MSTGKILSDHDAEWQPALEHEFLQLCKDGSVSPAAFNKWLQQDRIFVEEFIHFARHVLLIAPESDREVIRDGCAALDEELSWMDDKIAERNLDAAMAPLPTTAAYCTYLQSLQTQPYAVLAAAFFAIEYVYNQAWAGVLGGDARYQEFAERWGSSGFGTYVNLLQAQADGALNTASDGERRDAEEVAGVQIPRLEVQFWQMALD